MNNDKKNSFHFLCLIFPNHVTPEVNVFFSFIASGTMIIASVHDPVFAKKEDPRCGTRTLFGIIEYFLSV